MLQLFVFSAFCSKLSLVLACRVLLSFWSSSALLSRFFPSTLLDATLAFGSPLATLCLLCLVLFPVAPDLVAKTVVPLDLLSLPQPSATC